jgi:hypothetical protein
MTSASTTTNLLSTLRLYGSSVPSAAPMPLKGYDVQGHSGMVMTSVSKAMRASKHAGDV